jgi:hypothetical protein
LGGNYLIHQQKIFFKKRMPIKSLALFPTRELNVHGARDVQHRDYDAL